MGMHLKNICSPLNSREYWDGSNISPLTADDKSHLLGIFERWDLEDFDVVAFGYTPVPVSVQVLW